MAPRCSSSTGTANNVPSAHFAQAQLLRGARTNVHTRAVSVCTCIRTCFWTEFRATRSLHAYASSDILDESTGEMKVAQCGQCQQTDFCLECMLKLHVVSFDEMLDPHKGLKGVRAKLSRMGSEWLFQDIANNEAQLFITNCNPSHGSFRFNDEALLAFDEHCRIQSCRWQWAVFCSVGMAHGYFRTLELDEMQTETDLGFDVDHLQILAMVLHQSEINTYVGANPLSITIEVCGTIYKVDSHEIDGYKIILVTHPLRAVYFPNIGHESVRWRHFDEVERCFVPFEQDPLLYTELNASFFANRMESTSMFRSLYMLRLSALCGEMFFIRYSKAQQCAILRGYHGWSLRCLHEGRVHRSISITLFIGALSLRTLYSLSTVRFRTQKKLNWIEMCLERCGWALDCG